MSSINQFLKNWNGSKQNLNNSFNFFPCVNVCADESTLLDECFYCSSIGTKVCESVPSNINDKVLQEYPRQL